MSTRLYKSRKNKTSGSVEKQVRHAFREDDLVDYSLHVEAQVEAMNKTFQFPGMVSLLLSHDSERRLKALRKLKTWLGEKDSLQSGQFDLTELVENATKLFQRLKRYGMKHDFEEEELVLKLLEILSKDLKSVQHIIYKRIFVKELYHICYNVQAKHQEEAAKILHNLTKISPDITRQFTRVNNPLQELSKIFTRQVCTLYFPKSLWNHLADILEVFPKGGIRHGLFDVVANRVKDRLHGFHLENMRCLTAFLQCQKGVELFIASNIMQDLLRMITAGSPEMNYEYVLKCFNMALNSEELQKQCLPYLDLPFVLSTMAKKTRNVEIQATCFDIIGKFYLIKPFDTVINQKCVKLLRSVKTPSENIDTEPENNNYSSVLGVLEILSASPKCAPHLASVEAIVKELYKNAKYYVFKRGAKILANLTSGSEASVRKFADTYKSYERMIDILKNSPDDGIPYELWQHLSHLIYLSPKEGLTDGIYDICEGYVLRKHPGFEKGPLLCYSKFLQSNKAFAIFESSDVLTILLKFISDIRNRHAEFQNIFECLNEAFQSEKLIAIIKQYPNLPYNIVQILVKTKDPVLQLLIFEILSKLCFVIPYGTRMVEKCLVALRKVPISNDNVLYEKRHFMNLLDKMTK